MKYELPCPVCGKVREFATKAYFYKARKYNKTCKSCSNSIQLGGLGNLYNSAGEKLCIDCNIHKPISDFHKNKKKYLSSVCINCSKERSKAYHKSYYKYEKYGITKEEFDRIQTAQLGECAICNKPIFQEGHIDHCHATGKVRGILCGKCNKGLGLFDDNVIYLTNAIKYLTK
jgi:hypothetical protein